MRPTIIKIILFSISFIIFRNSYAQNESKYERQEIMITMRDGIKLNTVIFSPKNNSEALPFLFLRTPYGVSEYPAPDQMPYTKDMADDKYIFFLSRLKRCISNFPSLL